VSGHSRRILRDNAARQIGLTCAPQLMDAKRLKPAPSSGSVSSLAETPVTQGGQRWMAADT
jgi:hypothetical protein